MKLQIDLELPEEKEEFKEYMFKDVCGEFGAKNLYKFIKPWTPHYSPTYGNYGRRYYGCFHILTDEQINDILRLCYNTDIAILTQVKSILDRPIEELSEVNNH